MLDLKLARLGGVCGILLGVLLIAGTAMHGSVPFDPVQGLAYVRSNRVWTFTHVMAISAFVPIVIFYTGLGATFRVYPIVIKVGKAVLVVGVVVGMLHLMSHLGTFLYLARQYETAAGTPLGSKILIVYAALHHYGHFLDRMGALMLMLVILLHAAAMLKNELFARWVGVFGLVAGSWTIVSITIGETFLTPRDADLLFAAGLLPSVVWLSCTGVVMLRPKASAESPR